MRKLILFVAVCFLSLSAQAQVMSGTVSARQVHRAWSSLLLTVGQTTEARSISAALDDNVGLALDFAPPACRATLVLLFSLPRAATVDNTFRDITLSFRADNRTRFDLPGSSHVTMGDSTAIIGLDPSDRFMELISEMRKGASLRVKIAFNGNEDSASYLTFSLGGFTASYLRAFDLCAKPSPRMRDSARSPRDRL